MKRALVFLLLAPAAVFFAVVSIGATIAGTKSLDIVCLGAMALSLLAMPVSAVAAAVDGFLSRSCPVISRVCLTAIVGATVATGEAAVFSSLLPPSLVMALAIGGAAVTAACSLLSHDYSGRTVTSAQSNGSVKSSWFGPAGSHPLLS
jgi:hypothetical protein